MNIDPLAAIEEIENYADAFGKAKGNVAYLTEHRKTIIAIGFQQSLKKTMAERDADSYTTQEFKTCALGIKEAVGEAERLRWMLVAAQAKFDYWRSMEASNRFVGKATL